MKLEAKTLGHYLLPHHAGSKMKITLRDILLLGVVIIPVFIFALVLTVTGWFKGTN
jgi:hypothetical protein